MFKIGEFSKFSRVSVRMLRHYDRLGLLTPVRVEPTTGYRYYSADQLPRLNRLLALRDLGFTLEQIGGLLGDDVPAEQIRGMLRLKRAELEQQLAEEQRRLERVEARLKQIERQGRPQAVEVLLRRVPPLRAATLRRVVPADAEVHELFDEVERHVARYGARAEEPPLAIFHDAEYDEDALDVEIAIPIRADLPGTERIAVRVLPGCESMACLVHRGDYDSLDETTSALLGWIETNGYGLAGPSREVYLRFNADGAGVELPGAFLAQDPREFVTEVQVPVTRA